MSIDAKDLMIGNWVNFAYTHKKVKNTRPCQVLEIHADYVVVRDLGLKLTLNYETDAVEPIPLTPEILTALDFIPNRIGALSIEINDAATHLELIEQDGYYFPTIDQMQDIGQPQSVSLNRIKFLHELQNLFYALTQTEINYKP